MLCKILNSEGKGYMQPSVKTRLIRNKLGISQYEYIAQTFDTGLTIGSHSLAQWLAQEFNHNFDAYDKAIDYVYINAH
jgi:hypothetical protein